MAVNVERILSGRFPKLFPEPAVTTCLVPLLGVESVGASLEVVQGRGSVGVTGVDTFLFRPWVLATPGQTELEKTGRDGRQALEELVQNLHDL